MNGREYDWGCVAGVVDGIRSTLLSDSPHNSGEYSMSFDPSEAYTQHDKATFDMFYGGYKPYDREAWLRRKERYYVINAIVKKHKQLTQNSACDSGDNG